METCNKIHLLLFVCLSFNLLSVRATCAPRSFRYLEPKQASASSSPVPPTPTSSPPPSVPKPTPPPVLNRVVPPSPPKPATPAAPVKQQAAPATVTPPPAPVKQQATPATVTPPPAPQQKQATPTPATPPPAPQQQATPAAATPPPTQTQQGPPPTAKPAPTLLPTLTNPLGAPGQVNTDVRRVCDATDNPLLCLNTVSPLLQGKFDLVSILETEVKACKNQAQTLLDKSIKISADPATVADVAKTLKICKENYESVLDNMDATLKAIGEKDLGTVNTMLSAAISDVSTCGENFSEVSTNPNPLSDMEQLVTNLVGNCLSISVSLKW
ncbi:Plant invertase/pectin methylesterase inhibitor superfamily protein [Thalictrum thalictroides]|uniref:Plant invertase/pectin methylesterase inhibitor superfamily protein n=1 Tax=Thalictrum thalictroides TaxID=46969 RepID=A0A7J6WAE6_THATH|nr:Plant invertase/pectin methylesterase inhibitor superfamily protein [Thalictrum thalictroides]